MKTRREFLVRTAAGILVSASVAQAAGRKVVHAGSKDKVLRLAIVGTGQISPRYLRQGALSHRAKFVATCAHTLESAKARALEYKIDAWFDDYAKMYDTVKPDGVVIATPNGLHVEPTLAAFERGIHVLCEKPMATTWEECQTMVATAERDRLTFLCMPFDGDAMFRAAVSYLNENTLGVFTGAESQSFIPGVARGDWYYDSKQGGGAVFNSLVYSVSRVVDLLGPAKRVTGFVNTLIPHRILGDGEVVHKDPPPHYAQGARTVEPTADDNVTLLLEWASGQQAVLRNMWATSSIFNEDAVIYGRRGTLWLSGKDLVIHSPERVIADAEPITWNGQKACYRIPVTPAESEGLIEHFVDCIQGLSPPTCGGQARLHVHEILFKGIEASRSGQTQTLQTTFTPWHPIDPVFLDTRSGFV
jgi:predicted dehydrogenase